MVNRSYEWVTQMCGFSVLNASFTVGLSCSFHHLKRRRHLRNTSMNQRTENSVKHCRSDSGQSCSNKYVMRKLRAAAPYRPQHTCLSEERLDVA